MNDAASRRWWTLIVAVALLAAACGSGGDDRAEDDPTVGVAALPASFDLAAESSQRFLLGLVGPEQESIAYGSIDLTFTYTGPANQPLDDPEPGPTATAEFIAVSGDQTTPGEGGPRAVSSSQARGVYGTEPLQFPEPGFWEVRASFTLDDNPTTATAAFEVLPANHVVTVGQPAPPTDNPLAGDPGTPPAAIDSRARDGEPVPDPELHETSVAAALDRGLPLLVVVSTPTYCISRFCGPITDAVSDLAARYGDQMAFVHLEVWADFEQRIVNPAAAEWIASDGAEGNEPWVFVIDRTGTVAERFDNVANAELLDEAIQEVLR